MSLFFKLRDVPLYLCCENPATRDNLHHMVDEDRRVKEKVWSMEEKSKEKKSIKS